MSEIILSSSPLWIRVTSSYTDDLSSRYRLSISDLTIIDSLKAQTIKDFSILLVTNQDDPHLTRRIEKFREVGVFVELDETTINGDYHMLDVTDDDYLSPQIAGYCWELIESNRLRYEDLVIFENGYVYKDGVIKVLNNQDRICSLQRRLSGYICPTEVRQQARMERAWIHVRHGMNSTPHLQAFERGATVQGLRWKVAWNILQRVCVTRMAEGTAGGSTLGIRGKVVKAKKTRVRK